MLEMPLYDEIKQRLGVLPNFFRLTSDSPDVTANLWEFAKSAYLDSSMPSLFKERLFVYLSRCCGVQYCLARHIGFLVGLGYPAGDRDCLPQTVEQVLPLLQRPLSHGEELETAIALCSAFDPDCFEFPSPDSPAETAIFACATHTFLQTPDAPRALAALRQGIGARRLERLNLLLAFVRMAHYWTQTHPELRFEADINNLLATHAALADCLFNDSAVEDHTLSCKAANRENGLLAERLGRQRQQSEHHGVVPDMANVNRAEAALHESQELCRILVFATSKMVWRADTEGNITDEVSGWEQFTGQTFDEYKDFGWLAALHPDDVDLISQVWQTAVTTHRPAIGEYRLRTGAGDYHRVAVRGEPLLTAHGNFGGWVGTITDIEDMRRAEEAELIALNQLRLASTETSSGTWLEKHIPLVDQPQVRAAIQAAIQTKSTFESEHRVIQRDGTVGWTFSRAIPLLNAQDEIVEWLGAASDISERKRREANLVFLADVAKDFSRLATADEIMQTVGAKVGTYLNISNCCFAEINEAQNQAIVERAWHTPDTPDVTGVYQLSDFITAEFRQAARSGETIVIRNTQTDPRTDRERYAALKIHAYVTVPFHRAGEWKYLFTVSDSVARNWREDEIELIREVTNRTFPRLERAYAEAALAASEEKYRTLFTSINEGYALCELLYGDGEPIDWRILEVNPAFESMTGFANAAGKTARELNQALNADWLRTFGTVAQTGEPTRFEHHMSSIDYWFEISVSRIDADKRQIIVVFNNITEAKRDEVIRKQAAAHLRRAAKMDALRVTLSDALRPLSDPEEIKYQAVCALGEYLGSDRAYYVEIDEAQAEFVVARDWHQPGAPSHARRYPIEGWPMPWLVDGQPWVVRDVDTDAAMPDDQRASYRDNHIGALIVVPLIKGGLVATLATNQQQPRDWSLDEIAIVQETAERTWAAVERAYAEVALRESEERYRSLTQQLEQRVQERTAQLEVVNQELEAFSHSISHDLKTPLSYIALTADRLSQKLDTAQDAVSLRYLRIISQSACQAGTMVDDLLEFSRMGRLEMRWTAVQMEALVQQVLHQLQSETSGRSIHWQIQPLLEVQGDPAMLRLVWQNLLANAIKYTCNRAEAIITIGSSNCDAETVFFIQDNGAGFDMRYHHRLFNIFQRLHSQQQFAGTGVGLANVRRIIHRHGGRTWAEGAIDQGATIYFSLPKGNQHDTSVSAT